jgi:hypothetical protein
MDFLEIGRLVSDDKISLEYLWKKQNFWMIEKSQIKTKGESIDPTPKFFHSYEDNFEKIS